MRDLLLKMNKMSGDIIAVVAVVAIAIVVVSGTVNFLVSAFSSTDKEEESITHAAEVVDHLTLEEIAFADDFVDVGLEINEGVNYTFFMMNEDDIMTNAWIQEMRRHRSYMENLFDQVKHMSYNAPDAFDTMYQDYVDALYYYELAYSEMSYAILYDDNYYLENSLDLFQQGDDAILDALEENEDINHFMY